MKFSSLRKLIRVTSLVVRFVSNLKHRVKLKKKNWLLAKENAMFGCEVEENAMFSHGAEEKTNLSRGTEENTIPGRGAEENACLAVGLKKTL